MANDCLGLRLRSVTTGLVEIVRFVANCVEGGAPVDGSAAQSASSLLLAALAP
jgi:hypothetical protein